MRGLMIVVLLLVGCGGSTATEPAPATLEATTTPTPAPTVAVTTAPTPTVAVSPSPSTAACSVSPSVDPALEVVVLFSGNGFQPGSIIDVTDVGPAGTNALDPVAVEQFRVGADGTFGPLDLTYSGTEEIGSHTLTFTDGACEATLEFTIDG